MPLSKKERVANGRLGGRARAENLSPERRSEIARKAHLASAVSAVVNRAPELTPDQLNTLRALFGGAQ